MSRRSIVPVVVALTVVMVGVSWWRDAQSMPLSSVATRPQVPTTTREALASTVAAMEARLNERPDDGDAVVRLAEALIRVQRVNRTRRQSSTRSATAGVPGAEP